MESNTKFMVILWTSFAGVSTLANIFLSGFHAVGINPLASFRYYLEILIFLLLSVSNLRFYYKLKEKETDVKYLHDENKTNVKYVFGQDPTMELLTQQVEEAKDSICVTQFSKGSLEEKSKYFAKTNQRIKGKNKVLYRRIINLDSHEKINFAISLIENYWEQDNFFLKETKMFIPFDLFLIDDTSAVILFHFEDSARITKAAMKFTNYKVVSMFRDIYNSIWNNERTNSLQESPLSEQKKEKIIEQLKSMIDDISE